MKQAALITGASSGIGFELAKYFAADKINLLLVARSAEKMEQLAEQLRKDFLIEVHVVPKDLGDYSKAYDLFNYCEENQLQIDYLVNNAGFGDYGNFAESQWSKQQSMINLNITCLTLLTHLFLPGMLKRKFGRILNVASIAAFMPGPFMSVYYATKAYVLHFSEGLSGELQGSGVSITALCPGPTESGFQAGANMEDSKLLKGRKMPSSNEVAKYGYRSMMKGKTVAIHGILNKIVANAIRFTPRSLAVKIIRMVQSK